MRIVGLCVAVMAAAFPSVVGAATILNLNPTIWTLSYVDLTSAGDQNLDPGGAYSGLSDVYVFSEGAGVMQANSFTNFNGLAGLFTAPFLLHYDRDPGRGGVSGSFDLQLGGGESLFGWVTNKAGLDRTDFVSGADYPTASNQVRGLESLTDTLGVLDLGGGLFRISYALDNTATTVDEARFFVTSVSGVPEAQSWAMMITGFGLVGGALRRRRDMRVAYAGG